MLGRTPNSIPLVSGRRGLAAAAALCACMTGCQDLPGAPEEAVREWVRQGTELAREKNRRGLLDMVSRDYADARGNDREAIGELLRFYFLRTGTVALVTRIESLQVVRDSAAELTLIAGMAGTNEGVFGFSADAYRFEMELERRSGDWLLIGARWGELGEEPH